MAPIPGIIREAARLESQYGMNWTDYRPYTNITTTHKHTSYSKLANISHKFHDEWPILAVTIASVLFAIIVVNIVARCCFGGRHRYPRQTVPTEDKMKTKDDEYLHMVEEPCSNGWMCFILACHAAITLGAV